MKAGKRSKGGRGCLVESKPLDLNRRTSNPKLGDGGGSRERSEKFSPFYSVLLGFSAGGDWEIVRGKLLINWMNGQKKKKIEGGYVTAPA